MRIDALLDAGPPLVVVATVRDVQLSEETLRELHAAGTPPGDLVLIIDRGIPPTATGIAADIPRAVLATSGNLTTDVRELLTWTDQDLVLVKPGTQVANGFLRALRHAAYAQSDVGLVLERGPTGCIGYVRRSALQRASLPPESGQDVSEFLTALADELVRHGSTVTTVDGPWPALAPREREGELPTESPDRDAGWRTPAPQRVLYSLHAGDGGTPATARDLAGSLGNTVDAFVLTCDTEHLRLWQIGAAGAEVQLEDIEFAEPLRFMQPSEPEYRALVERIIVTYGIDVVHVRHVFRHTLDLPSVAHALGCRVILSIHDSYLICPTIHLLDDHGRFCGGVCTPGHGTCQVGPEWLRPVAPTLKHDYVHHWRRLVAAMLKHVDVAVTTSTSMRDLITAAYPELLDRIRIIEHGRELEPPPSVVLQDPPEALDRPLRVLVPGFLAYHKGGEVFRQLRALDADGEIEFHLLGHVERAYRDVGVAHGRYGRDEFNDHVRSIEPDVAAILSICAESYCHTLTESWSAGLPVVGTPLGAVGERIARDGGGWIVDVEDPEGILALLRQLKHAPASIRTAAAEITAERFIPAAEMAAAYLDVYRARDGAASLCAIVGTELQPSVVQQDATIAVDRDSRTLQTVPVPPGQTRALSARLERYLAVAIIDPDAVAPADLSALLAACASRHLPLLITDRWRGSLPEMANLSVLRTTGFEAADLAPRLFPHAPSDAPS